MCLMVSLGIVTPDRRQSFAKILSNFTSVTETPKSMPKASTKERTHIDSAPTSLFAADEQPPVTLTKMVDGRS